MAQRSLGHQHYSSQNPKRVAKKQNCHCNLNLIVVMSTVIYIYISIHMSKPKYSSSILNLRITKPTLRMISLSISKLQQVLKKLLASCNPKVMRRKKAIHTTTAEISCLTLYCCEGKTWAKDQIAKHKYVVQKDAYPLHDQEIKF
jgi:hypothetical protein